MKIFILFFFPLLIAVSTVEQSNDENYAKALKLKTEYKYKEALPLFQILLKADSNNINYLTNASYLYTKYSFYYLPENQKRNYYKTAERLALKAIKVNDNNADAHYVYTMALGRINENASSKQKIANAKLIKTQLDKALQINPRLAGAYHILGRWHRTIAGFSSIEKVMINSFFGGVPEGGSYEDAIKCFMTAITLEPKFMLHQYELAETYYEMDKKVEAKIWTDKALELTPQCEDDFKAKENLLLLLTKLK